MTQKVKYFTNNFVKTSGNVLYRMEKAKNEQYKSLDSATSHKLETDYLESRLPETTKD